jgi:hypothetical protein
MESGLRAVARGHHNFNGGHTGARIRWPWRVEQALEKYVSEGGGLVVYHAANNAFLVWRAYNDMIGLRCETKASELAWRSRTTDR